MSDEEFAFAPPPFKPAEALVRLQRDLRDWRVLTERGGGFEWKGLPAATLEVADGVIRAQLARRPSRSPDWDRRELQSAAEVRTWLADAKKRIARWDDDD